MNKPLLFKSIVATTFALMFFDASAQQDPLYAQYFNNPMLINPAFAGSNERLYAGVAYRTQWSGVDGGPKTFNANGHIALMNNKVGIGAVLVQDQIGDIKNTQYGAVGAYHIKLLNTKFSFGMQMGATRFATDPNAVRVQNPDPLFAQLNETKFNTGVGVLLQNERYTLSLSVPRILSSTVSQGGQSIQVYGQNYYLYGSYLIYLNDLVQFKPSALLRMAKNSSVSADVNLNLIFKRLYTAGIFARNLNTYGVLVQAVMGNYRFGYTLEVPGKSSALNFTSNEISFALSLDVLNSHNHSASGF
ncbi:MAG TPA: type IX secretion system membrane protein PorP/SprF [Cyclobacteriaceae bacterium]|nr:type IX secretion system membrane protein PorP/SprF [Cyclobacteriaceae bacterium]